MTTEHVGNHIAVEFAYEITSGEAPRPRHAVLCGPGCARATVASSMGPASPAQGVRETAPAAFFASAAPIGPLDEAARNSRIALELTATTLEELRVLTTDVHDVARVAMTLLERLTDPTHLTVSEAARFLGLSEKTVRTRIKSGALTLETIPGTRRRGIPLRQLSSGWVSAKFARELGVENR